MSRRKPSRFNGALPVVKSAGPTSHDVVDLARKALRERRIGHTGTLDPMAEGLLLLCVGQATRLQSYLLSWDKTYRGSIQLGHATTTYDAEGEPMDPSGEPPVLEESVLREAEEVFSGEISQQPPPYSAKKVAGKRLYELARSGQTVEVEPKLVHVHELKLEPAPGNRLTFEVRTSSGFYVRSMAHDLGKRLGCGGHLAHLERVRIGPYTTEDALAQQALEDSSSPEEIIEGPSWHPLEKIALPFVEIALNPGAQERFCNGQEVIVLHMPDVPVAAEDLVTIRGHRGKLLGIGLVQAVLARGRTVCVRPRMVLQTHAKQLRPRGLS